MKDDENKVKSLSLDELNVVAGGRFDPSKHEFCWQYENAIEYFGEEKCDFCGKRAGGIHYMNIHSGKVCCRECLIANNGDNKAANIVMHTGK